MAERTAATVDAEVVGRVRRGEREAYRELVDKYQDTLYRYALSLVGEPDAAADIVQATFVHAYARLRTLREDASYGGWVYRMCMNRCRDHLKNVRQRNVPLEQSPQDALTSALRADDELDRAELRRSLDEALDSLNDEYREAFVLKHVEELSYEEMSQLLGASVAALKMRVHRAREALKRTLEEVL